MSARGRLASRWAEVAPGVTLLVLLAGGLAIAAPGFAVKRL